VRKRELFDNNKDDREETDQNEILINNLDKTGSCQDGSRDIISICLILKKNELKRGFGRKN
jgi:hypothetical protein